VIFVKSVEDAAATAAEGSEKSQPAGHTVNVRAGVQGATKELVPLGGIHAVDGWTVITGL
jgi:hypothetical protein